MRLSAATLILVLIGFSAGAAEDCAFETGGRIMVIPPIRYRVDIGGSVASRMSDYFGTGPASRPITLCALNIRLELNNISDQTQHVWVYLRKDSEYSLSGVPGVGAGKVSLGGSAKKTFAACYKGPEIQLQPFQGKAMVLQWVCSISASTLSSGVYKPNGDCTLSLAAADGSVVASPDPIPKVTFNSWFDSTPPAGPDLQADASCNSVSAITVQVKDNRGAVVAGLSTLAVRGGGYDMAANGDVTIGVNGGRAF